VNVLLVFNREPYDNTDVTWNGLRLAGKLRESVEVKNPSRDADGDAVA